MGERVSLCDCSVNTRCMVYRRWWRFAIDPLASGSFNARIHLSFVDIASRDVFECSFDVMCAMS